MRYSCQIVIDLEFNPVPCGKRDLIRNEIIEIGAIKLDEDLREIGRFSTCVRPELGNAITGKIVRLTGIRTLDVKSAPSFSEAVSALSAWAGEGLCRVLSWSFSDLYQLRAECEVKGVEFPKQFGRWMNFQAVWGRIIDHPRRYPLNLEKAAEMAGVGFDGGEAHRALYDTEVTVGLLRLTRDPQYLRSIEDAKNYLCTETPCESSPLGSLCGGALADLLRQMQTA